MLNRHLVDFGITPILAYLLSIIGFFYGSLKFFEKYEFTVYAYVFIGVGWLLKLSEKHRNDFLKLSFTSKKYKNIRVVENLLLITPYILFLIYKQFFLSGLILASSAVLLSFIQINTNTSFTIPTLYKKYPFEFTEGFRKTFFVFPLAYIFTIIGIKVDNFNLGIFSLILIFGVALLYFSKTEKSYHVWLFNKSPKEFLYAKIKTAIIYTSWLSLPIIIVLSVFFIDEIIILIAYQLIGYVYLIQFILAKYAVFPKQISLPTVIIFTISIAFPPFVFFTFWHFYKKAIQQLNTVLND